MAVIIDGTNTPTLGGVGYGDGSELAFTSAGTSGQVLTSAGGATPTWNTPVQAMTLISTQTASASATISWTGLATYDTYVLIFKNVTLSNSYIRYQVGTGSTPTYISANYNGILSRISSPSTIGTATVTTTFPELHAPNSSGPINGTCTFYNMVGTNFLNVISQVGSQGSPYNFVSLNSTYQSTTTGPYTAIKLAPEVGTLTGTFSLYGISQ